MVDASTLISNAAITDPTALATSIAGSGWNDWRKNLSPYLQSGVLKSAAASDGIAGNNLAAATSNLGASSAMMGDYNNIYRPAGAKLGTEVNELGTGAYKSQQRGQAMADVQSQISNQADQNSRAMSRMGVNPSSGRALAMQNQNAIMGAAAKAGAASNSDRAVQSQYMAGLKDLSTTGLDLTKAANAMDGSAQRWSALGMDASQAGSKLGMDYGKLTAQQADAYGTVAARAGAMANSNAMTASNIQAIKDSNSIPNLLLSGAVKAGSTYLNSNLTKGLGSLYDKYVGSQSTPTDMTGFITPSEPITYDQAPVDTSGNGLNFDTLGNPTVLFAN
jgi:hypothetical protein